MQEKEEAEENKCNNIYISESVGRARMVQQFWNRSSSTVLCIRVGMIFKTICYNSNIVTLFTVILSSFMSSLYMSSEIILHMISISNQTRLVNSYRFYCQTWSCYIESREGHVNGARPKLHNDIRISNALL